MTATDPLRAIEDRKENATSFRLLTDSPLHDTEAFVDRPLGGLRMPDQHNRARIPHICKMDVGGRRDAH